MDDPGLLAAIAAGVAFVLILMAILLPAFRMTVGILLMIIGFIGTMSVMAMFIGLPMMFVGLVIVVLDIYGRRAANEPPRRRRD
ncbi:MAG: hypothetical protein WD294_12830 [Phycisphaeraceae bacterium]